MKSLTELARGCATDKGAKGYLPAYELLFAPRRDDLLTLLEVGVYGGGGLLLWERYFPKAEVVGVDIDLSRLDLADTRGRISVVEADARCWTPTSDFDIIIDDGSHTHEDVLAAYEQLCPYLRRGGLYVVEDVSSPIPRLQYDLVAPYLAVVD